MTFPRLTVLTDNFPFATGEEFLAKELPYLAGLCKQVDVVPTARLTAYDLRTLGRQLPAHVRVRRDVAAYLHDARKLPAWKRAAWVLGDVDGLRLLSHGLPQALHATGISPGPTARRVRATVNYVGHALLVRDAYRRFDLPLATYGFWLNAAVLGAALAAARPLICRAHRADLYAEHAPQAFLPLQQMTLAHVDRAFFISAHGLRYAQACYPTLAHRFTLARLGVDAAPSATPSAGPTLHLVSCSTLQPIKRLSVLIDALRACAFPVVWTHLGDGPLRARLQRAARQLPPHITVRWLGAVPHAQVLTYYATHPVDLFINVSASEGLPVSVMEALSCGVPVVAPDVGGMGEVISQRCGMLLPALTTPAHVSAALQQFVNLSRDARQSLRDGARRSWEQHVNAPVQYGAFIETLKNINGFNRLPAL